MHMSKSVLLKDAQPPSRRVRAMREISWDCAVD